MKETPVVEIDTRFYDHTTGEILDLGVTWIDTLGTSNEKHSYWAPELMVFTKPTARRSKPAPTRS